MTPFENAFEGTYPSYGQYEGSQRFVDKFLHRNEVGKSASQDGSPPIDGLGLAPKLDGVVQLLVGSASPPAFRYRYPLQAVEKRLGDFCHPVFIGCD